MNRVWYGLVCVGLTIWAGGCTQCASPYDYCGPTFTGPCGDQPCAPKARMGSILDPYPVTDVVGGDADGEVFSGEPTPAEPQIEDSQPESLPDGAQAPADGEMERTYDEGAGPTSMRRPRTRMTMRPVRTVRR